MKKIVLTGTALIALAVSTYAQVINHDPPLFTVGFVLREYGAFHYDNLDVYIASICITYAAPYVYRCTLKIESES